MTAELETTGSKRTKIFDHESHEWTLIQRRHTMATYRFVRLNLPEAQLLEDLTGIKRDFDQVIDICDLVLEVGLPAPNQSTQAEALTCAAIIKYARPFSTGVRINISEKLRSVLTRDELVDHNWFQAMRHCHVAHSVNAHETNTAIAYLEPEERGRSITQIQVTGNYLVALGSRDTSKLKTLATKLSEHVEKMISEEKQKILEIMQARDINVLYQQQDPPMKNIARSDTKKGRRK